MIFTFTKKTILLCLLIAYGHVALCQAPFLKGKVSTPQGTAITQASVEVLNTGFSTYTDNNGAFTFINVPAGIYQLKVSAAGYAAVIVSARTGNMALPGSIVLQQADKQLDEVLVTAQKRQEDPQKLPLSLTALTARQVEDDRLWNSKDLTALIPNLYSASPGDNRNVMAIRGIATSSYDQAVATYIDGVSQFGLDTYIAQLENIERIEILRGPQGTLYGRNATGGVINIITKQPANKTQIYASVDAGNYNLQRYHFGLNIPLINNKLFLGVSGLYSRQNGFYYNIYTQHSFDDQHSTLGNYYLKYLASPRLSVTLNVKHVANRNNGAFPLTPDAATALSNPFKINQNNTTTLIDNIFNSSLSVQYTGSNVNFTSQSAYQDNYRYYTQPIDGDFSPIDGVSIINNYGNRYNKVHVATQEFRLSSPAASSARFKWVAGTYGFYSNSPVKQGTHFGSDAELVGAPFPDFTSINTNKQTRYGLAFYGQGTYALSARLGLTAGLRYDVEHARQQVTGAFQMDGGPTMVTRSDTAAAATFRAFSPKLSLAYQAGSATGIFGSYSRGYRAGGISQLSSDPSQPPLFIYKPETSNNFEAGVKSEWWNHRVRLNATLFYTLINNAQVPTLVLPDAITVTHNAGKLKSRGAELEATLKPFAGLEAGYSFGYTHARYALLNIPVNGDVVNLKDNHQVFTPAVTSMLTLQYSHKLGARYRALVHTEWRYLGNQYFDLANNIKQNGYSLFNTRLGISSKNVGLFLWGANIFNKHYIDYAYDFGAAHLGNPKTYGLSIQTWF